MHASTPEVSAAVRSAGSTQDQLHVLRNAYEGAKGVILTCGPSLADHQAEMLAPLLEDRVVFAVKQAIDVAGPSADFLCFNAYNAARYDPPNADTISVFTEDPDQSVSQLNDVDVKFLQRPHSGDLSDSLAATCDYEGAMLSADASRPWGPGILHEVVFPLVVHLGLSEVVTIGWDIANDRGNNVHFYDQPADDFFDRGRADAYRMVGLRRHLPGPVKRVLRSARLVVNHRTGDIYNRTTMIVGEAELVAASTPALYRWLQDHGVDLQVVSDASLVADEVPRLSLKDLYALG